MEHQDQLVQQDILQVVEVDQEMQILVLEEHKEVQVVVEQVEFILFNQ
jgi:hypothetical protein